MNGPNATVSVRYAMQCTLTPCQNPWVDKILHMLVNNNVNKLSSKLAHWGRLRWLVAHWFIFVVKLLASAFFKSCFLSFNTAFLPLTATYQSILRTSVWRIFASFILDLFFCLAAGEGQSVVMPSKNKNRRIPPGIQNNSKFKHFICWPIAICIVVPNMHL